MVLITIVTNNRVVHRTLEGAFTTAHNRDVGEHLDHSHILWCRLAKIRGMMRRFSIFVCRFFWVVSAMKKSLRKWQRRTDLRNGFLSLGRSFGSNLSFILLSFYPSFQQWSYPVIPPTIHHLSIPNHNLPYSILNPGTNSQTNPDFPP
jgi:hypothetical protein